MQPANSIWTPIFKWEDDLSEDDLCSAYQMMNYCENRLDKWQWLNLQRIVEEAKKRARGLTAWRIEGTLREFPKFSAVNAWFSYPVHQMDTVGVLGDIQPEAEMPPWKRAMDKRKPKEQKAKERKESIVTAYDACTTDGKVTVSDLAEYLGVTEKTIRNRLKEHGGFVIDDSEVRKKT